jgi:hypothetical protein
MPAPSSRAGIPAFGRSAPFPGPEVLIAAGLALAALAIEGLLPVSQVLAQCPMCGKNAEFAGGAPGAAARTFAAAAVFLLAPALGVMGGMGALLWRHRGGWRRALPPERG